jgi:hypothetical protein
MAILIGAVCLVLLLCGLQPQVRAFGLYAWQRLSGLFSQNGSNIYTGSTIPTRSSDQPSVNTSSSTEINALEGAQHTDSQQAQVAERKAKIQEIKALIEKDDICELIKTSALNELAQEEIASLLDEKLSTPIALLTDPDALLKKSDNDPTIHFLNAIYTGGLFYKSPIPKKLKLNKSFKLLSELASSDPKNGSYLFFRAMIRSKLGQPSDMIQGDLIEMAEAQTFETPILNVSKEIHQWGLQTPSQFYLGTFAIGKVPTPDYLSISNLIREFLKQPDDHFRQLIFEWGQRVSRRHEIASTQREFVYWFALEYQIEISLSRYAWMLMHPDQQIPKELSKSYKDIRDNDPYRDQWQKALENTDHCDPSVLNDLIESQARDEASWRPAED